ncbi:MAG TPA: thiol:disulfide interchange protein DsbA/DsbL [Steroidobacteraceae bacterium]|jgi:thiol:disulfide interchange protein DsbA|nr:thiol:disulfide interchange protein DsbA/DsbL [Steroidobacteraceae bacterium]
MRRHLLLFPGPPLLGLLMLVAAVPAGAATAWVQGSNYFLLQPAQPTSVAPGKVEVTEVFSYACPACNSFYPVVDRLRSALPANAELDFVAASFRTDEDWPMFQRAFYAAQVLDIDKRTHEAMFDAVWKTGELAVFDPRTQRIKVPPPGIEDAARFYARVAGVKPETFVATANSFGVDVKMHQAEQFIRAAQVDQTPTIIVNGKYRVTLGAAGGNDQLIELVKYLVAQESANGAKPPVH